MTNYLKRTRAGSSLPSQQARIGVAWLIALMALCTILPAFAMNNDLFNEQLSSDEEDDLALIIDAEVLLMEQELEKETGMNEEERQKLANVFINACAENDREQVKNILADHDWIVYMSNEDEHDGMFHAVINRNIPLCTLLLKGHPELLNSRNFPDSKTALGYWAERGDAELCDFLLKEGANPDISDLYGNTPLHAAAWEGHTHILKLLIQHNANPFKITFYSPDDHERRDPSIPLDFACKARNSQAIELLEPYMTFSNRLHQAAIAGDVTAIEQILRRHRIVHVSNKEYVPTLILAARNGHQKACEKLLEFSAKPNYAYYRMVIVENISAADEAQRRGHTELAAFLNTQNRRVLSLKQLCAYKVADLLAEGVINQEELQAAVPVELFNEYFSKESK